MASMARADFSLLGRSTLEYAPNSGINFEFFRGWPINVGDVARMVHDAIAGSAAAPIAGALPAGLADMTGPPFAATFPIPWHLPPCDWTCHYGTDSTHTPFVALLPCTHPVSIGLGYHLRRGFYLALASQFSRGLFHFNLSGQVTGTPNIYGTISVGVDRTTIEADIQNGRAYLLHHVIPTVGVFDDVRLAIGLKARTIELFGRAQYLGYQFSTIGNVDLSDRADHSIEFRVVSQTPFRGRSATSFAYHGQPIFEGSTSQLLLVQSTRFRTEDGRGALTLRYDTEGKGALAGSYRLYEKVKTTVSAIWPDLSARWLPKLGLTLTYGERRGIGKAAEVLEVPAVKVDVKPEVERVGIRRLYYINPYSHGILSRP
jgi:hypothetical protein